MNRIPVLFGVFLALVLTSAAFAQYDYPCVALVTNPQEGDVWQAGTTYTLEWTLEGWECMYMTQFNAIELVGLSSAGDEQILDTLSSVPLNGPMEYTPSAAVAGYPAYFFRFWADSPWLPRALYLAGVSPEFLVVGDAAPDLVASPSSLYFILPVGNGTASSTVYVSSNNGAIRWTAAGSHSWLTAAPAQATSTEGMASVPVAVAVNATGLPPGKYPATMVFTGTGNNAQATVQVTLSVTDSGGGTADLAVAPDRVIFSQRVGNAIQPQQVTLSNLGTERTPWVVEVASEWLSVSPMEGYLAGGSSSPVTFSVPEPFSVPGSYRSYVHFKGSDGKDLAVLVELNLTEQSMTGAWPPAGLPRLTLPAAANVGGGFGSFWSTDVTVLATDRLARSAQARHKINALLSLPYAPSILGEARFDSLLDALLEETHTAAPRGTNQFIWGALGAKKARATEAVITETALPDDRPTLFLDILGRYFGLSGTSGFLQMAGEGADDVLMVSRTYTAQETGKSGGSRDETTEETYGQSVQAPGSQEIIGPAGGTAYVPGLRYEPASEGSKGWRTNLFVTEIGGVATAVTVQLYDVHGAPVGTPQSRTLEPFTQWPITNAGPALGTTLEWTYAAVTSAGGGQIVVLGSVVDNNSNDPTTINGLVALPGSRALEDLVLPAAVHNPGNAGTTWRSDVTLLNATASTLNVKVQFIPMTGAAAGVKEEWISIEPHGMGVYLDIVKNKFGLDPGTGTLRFLQVDPGTFFAYNRIYNLASNGFTYGQGTNAYRLANAVGHNDGTLYTVGLERSPQYRTNVGVVETAGASATVLFTVVAPTGESRGYMAKLAPGQWVQADDLIRDKAGFAEDFANVWVMIDVVEGAGRVIGYGSIIDFQSGDATYIKLEKR